MSAMSSLGEARVRKLGFQPDSADSLPASPRAIWGAGRSPAESIKTTNFGHADSAEERK
jgi:hypothetical protein